MRNHVAEGLAHCDLALTPWNPATSGVTRSHNVFTGTMGYDILRIRSAKSKGAYW